MFEPKIISNATSKTFPAMSVLQAGGSRNELYFEKENEKRLPKTGGNYGSGGKGGFGGADDNDDKGGTGGDSKSPMYHTGYTEYFDALPGANTSANASTETKPNVKPNKAKTGGDAAVSSEAEVVKVIPTQAECTAYFNAAYDRTVKAVTRFVVSKCKSLDGSEDILQNIYGRFYKYLTKNGWGEIQNEEAFVVHIAKFECQTYFASVTKHSAVTSFSDFSDEKMVEVERELSMSDKNASGLEDIMCNSILSREIYEYITTNEPDTGRIFYLHFACGMNLGEVADEIGMGLSQVKNKMYRMLDRLKRKYRV